MIDHAYRKIERAQQSIELAKDKLDLLYAAKYLGEATAYISVEMALNGSVKSPQVSQAEAKILHLMVEIANRIG